MIASLPLIEFRDSPIHGKGGFALEDIPSGARIVEYLGRRIDKEESQRQCELENPFIFSVTDEYDLDGNVDWNPARLLNHCCEPNAETEIDGGRIWVVAMRDIKAREEITFNYNYDLQDFREHPCKCGAAGCAGFIVAEVFFKDVRRPRDF